MEYKTIKTRCHICEGDGYKKILDTKKRCQYCKGTGFVDTVLLGTIRDYKRDTARNMEAATNINQDDPSYRRP